MAFLEDQALEFLVFRDTDETFMQEKAILYGIRVLGVRIAGVLKEDWTKGRIIREQFSDAVLDCLVLRQEGQNLDVVQKLNWWE